MRTSVSTFSTTARRLGCLIGLLGVLGAPGAAQAQTFASLPVTPSLLIAGSAARPIAAWVTFCEGYPRECAVDRTEPASIALTPAVWSTILAVNARVNRSVRSVTDMDHRRVPDHWDLAEDGSGDCEDFQLLKRKLLAEAGLPRRAMRMTVVIDEKGEGHAVLTLVTDRGDFILDNKTSTVHGWRQTGYTFIKRESQDVQAWVSLGRAASPATTANR